MKVQEMKRVLLVFGTRPEAIKMAPVIKELQKYSFLFTVKVCVTAQHREMLDQVLDVFDITPDYDLNIMTKSQNLYDLTAKILLGVQIILDEFCPDIVLVHGDTTTTSITALAAYYQRIKVAHIEAGLRTNNLYSPWPEEGNRQMVGVLATYHFAPTQQSKINLLKEYKNEDNILVTGNTVIDALFLTLNKIENSIALKEKIIFQLRCKNYLLQSGKKIILVTMHRRENFGVGFINICEALKNIALKNTSIDVVYPVHLNPNVQQPAKEILSDIKNIYLIEPLQYEVFIYLMSKSYFIITDSGGVQEEAPSLSKPVLVIRDTTERPEAVDAGTVLLTGTDKNKIFKYAQKLIDDKKFYESMANLHNPYGDGTSSKKIVEFLKERL